MVWIFNVYVSSYTPECKSVLLGRKTEKRWAGSIIGCERDMPKDSGYEWVVCDSICMCVSVSQCVRNSISDRVLTAVKIHAFLLLLLVDPKDPPLPPNNTPTPSDMVFTDHMRLSVMYSPSN